MGNVEQSRYPFSASWLHILALVAYSGFGSISLLIAHNSKNTALVTAEDYWTFWGCMVGLTFLICFTITRLRRNPTIRLWVQQIFWTIGVVTLWLLARSNSSSDSPVLLILFAMPILPLMFYIRINDKIRDERLAKSFGIDVQVALQEIRELVSKSPAQINEDAVVPQREESAEAKVRTIQNTECEFIVGDAVDWKRFTNQETSQDRFWHGVIVDEWNTTRDGHWFVVRWDASNKGGPYSGPNPDTDSNFTPFSPHYVEQQCRELRHCGMVPNLHPTVNRLPRRPETETATE